MKKCASCTKDLPDAALHCVFCGAKQPPAPALQPAMAKTVMGYSGNAELDALRQQAAATNAARPPNPAPSNIPAAAPYNAPRPSGGSQPPPGYGPGPFAPRPHSPSSAPLAPAAGANAPTMFAGPPMSAPQHMGPGPIGPQLAGAFRVPPPSGPGPGPGPAPYAPRPVAPLSASPPYLASQTAARAGAPIEPWKDSLRLMMFIWGGLLLAAFVTPISIDPLIFNWDAIIEGADKTKLPPLIMAAVGLLSIVVAAIPMTPAPRGTIALLLALSGIFVPMVIDGMPSWQLLVQSVGMVILVPALLVRHEYRDASLGRILITVGALAALVPYLIPENSSIPLVELFKAAIEAPGGFKILILLVLVHIVLLVLSLLAWMPAPASAGVKQIAWILILYPLVMHAASLFLVGDPSIVEKSPYVGIMQWVAGGNGADGAIAVGAMSIGVAYMAITAYGTASVIGKQLE